MNIFVRNFRQFLVFCITVGIFRYSYGYFAPISPRRSPISTTKILPHSLRANPLFVKKNIFGIGDEGSDDYGDNDDNEDDDDDDDEDDDDDDEGSDEYDEDGMLFGDDIIDNSFSDEGRNPLETLFHGNRVVFFDDSDNDPINMGVSAGSSPGPSLFVAPESLKNTMELALLPCDTPMFEGGRDLLNIFEMRYRMLMNKVEEVATQLGGDRLVGRCFVDKDGRVGAVGTLCKVIEHHKSDDGKAFAIIEGQSRIRIIRITQRLPYLIGEVELGYDDDDKLLNPSQGEEENGEGENDNQNLAFDVYSLLKQYLRISKKTTNPYNDHDEETTVGISPAVRDNRPLIAYLESNKEAQQTRLKLFSHAVANMLSTEPNLMQMLMQTRSTHFRLRGLKCVLTEAVSELSSLLVDDKLITIDILNDIKDMSFSPEDDDSDLLPPDGYKGLTLDSELGETMMNDIMNQDLARSRDSNDKEKASNDQTDNWWGDEGADNVLQ